MGAKVLRDTSKGIYNTCTTTWHSNRMSDNADGTPFCSHFLDDIHIGVVRPNCFFKCIAVV